MELRGAQAAAADHGDDWQRPLHQRQALGPAAQDRVGHLRGVLHPGDQGLGGVQCVDTIARVTMRESLAAFLSPS